MAGQEKEETSGGNLSASELQYLKILLEGRQFSKLEAHCRHLLLKSPETVSIYHILGLSLNGQQKYSDAIGCFQEHLEYNPRYSDSHTNLAIAYEKSGLLEEAINSYEEAVKILPDNHAVYDRLGMVLGKAEKWEEALKSFLTAVDLEPNQAHYHQHLGTACNHLGDWESALDCFTKALELKPEMVRTHHDIGLVLRTMGNLDAAVEAFRLAHEKEPSNLEALKNMGSIYFIQGDYDQAIGVFKEIVEKKPENAEAIARLGVAYLKNGNHGEAISLFLKALSFEGDQHWILINLAEALSIAPRSIAVTPELVTLVVQCLYEPRIESTALSAVSLRTLLEEASEKKRLCSPVALPEKLWGEEGQKLLIALLSCNTIPSIELEDYLVRLRQHYLEVYSEGEATADGLDLEVLCALGLQARINEYVWKQSEGEAIKVEALLADVNSDIASGQNPRELSVILVACYRRLDRSAEIVRWGLQQISRGGNSKFRELLIELVQNPTTENAIAQNMDVLTPVDDSVSKVVRNQYEDNPYPCWKSVTKNIPGVYTEQIANEILPNRVNMGVVQARPRVLVAGCGTGKHAIQCATAYKNSTVLAVDLSLSSLAYAKRKTEELGISNISYAQADILEIGALEDQFDVIECGGVLHHMKDPEAGLKSLLCLLKEEGFIKLGLYSALARQLISGLRDRVNIEGMETDDNLLRTFRSNLKFTDPELYQSISAADDFYAASSMRDLLLHVQEHQFTVPQLQALFEDNNLEFLGFVFREPKFKNNYRKMFPDDPACSNLSNWDVYETQYPRIFARMYQFWCRLKRF